MSNQQVTILVVGSGPYKASTAAVLSRCGYNVKETTDITISDHSKTLVEARSWVSKNSLRRLDGHSVKVICSMDAHRRYDRSWVDIMCLIFKKHSPFAAAVLQDKHIRSNPHLGRFISDLDRSTVLETMNDDCKEALENIIKNLEPFKITTYSNMKGETDAWSSEKVILFGRTGSGKSTVAQMLTLGHLDAGAAKFKASSSARGMTKDIDRGEGRGWHVTDTPGFGEAKQGTVSTKDATQKITKFIIDIGGIYSHFVYVVKKDRMNVYDERLWEFFNKVFAKAEANFTVVVTGCSDTLSTESINHLYSTFKGCNNFILVDFCPLSSDSELEEENKEVREESLLKLEDGLARIGVADIPCSEGEYSKESRKFIRSDLRAAISGWSSLSSSIIEEIGSAVADYLIVKPLTAIGGYFRKSEIDESFILLPQ